MAVRKPAAGPAQPAAAEERLAAVEAENSMLARAICRLAVARPGGNADLSKILTLELRMSRADAEAIIAAAQRAS